MLSVNVTSDRKYALITAWISGLKSCFNQVDWIAEDPGRDTRDASS